jgi:hypothetical protein
MAEAPLQTSAEGVHAEPRKTGYHFADLTIAGSAILISLISLVVAIQRGHVHSERRCRFRTAQEFRRALSRRTGARLDRTLAEVSQRRTG